jgi:hypothetical protein
MKDHNDYYVYAHTLPDGTVFYVGRGRGKRATAHYDRSSWWNRKVVKHYPNGHKITPVYLSENLSFEESNQIEQFWIAVHGKIKTRTDGTLVNICDGGGGSSGHTVSVENKKKTSERLRGKKLSPDVCHKMSIAKKGIPKSIEHRRKISEYRKGKPSPNKGMRWSAEQICRIDRDKMSMCQRKTDMVVISPSGESHIIGNRTSFAALHNLNRHKLSALGSYGRKSHKGWKFSHFILLANDDSENCGDSQCL